MAEIIVYSCLLGLGACWPRAQALVPQTRLKTLPALLAGSSACENFKCGVSMNEQDVTRNKSEEAIMAVENTAESIVREAVDQGRPTVERVSRAVKDGYDAAEAYVNDKGFDLGLGEFVRREP